MRVYTAEFCSVVHTVALCVSRLVTFARSILCYPPGATRSVVRPLGGVFGDAPERAQSCAQLRIQWRPAARSVSALRVGALDGYIA